MELIKAENAVTAIEGTAVHAPVSLSLSSGELGLLTGGNGCGKTSFLCAILGELELSTGTLRIDGKAVRLGDTHSLTRLTIRVIPQFPITPDSMTITEYLSAWDLYRPSQSRNVTLKEVMDEIIALTDHESDALIGTLSHGQKRLVDILLATASQPKIILADEPLAGLAQTKISWCIDRLSAFRTNGGAILAVAHEPERHFYNANWLYEMKYNDRN